MIFDDLIGQEGPKKKLTFYADSHKNTGVSPHILFQGAKGCGKTSLARRYAKKLCQDAGKVYVEINSSTISNNKQFFEQIYPQFADSKVVFFFDEVHKLPHDLGNDFLTILNTEKSNKLTYHWKGNGYEFDFTKWSILCGTTDPQALSSALRDRLTTVDFQEYTNSEMGQIIEKHTNLTFENGLLDEIALSCRGNPRSSVLRAKEITSYTEQYGAKHFDIASWNELKDTLGILPYGLTNDEFKILRLLKSAGPCTLTALCAATGNTRGYNQMLEGYLLKHGLMIIDGTPVKRIITTKGLKIV